MGVKGVFEESLPQPAMPIIDNIKTDTKKLFKVFIPLFS
jgi:hypothetical protein